MQKAEDIIARMKTLGNLFGVQFLKIYNSNKFSCQFPKSQEIRANASLRGLWGGDCCSPHAAGAKETRHDGLGRGKKTAVKESTPS